MKNRQMIPFFSSTFSGLTVCNIHVLFGNSQNSFSCCPAFGPFCSVKSLNFVEMLSIWIAHYTFLESRHPEVTKNLYYVFSPRGAKKLSQLMEYFKYGLVLLRYSSTNSALVLSVLLSYSVYLLFQKLFTLTGL